MKKILITILSVVALIIVIIGVGFGGEETKNQDNNSEYLRIHIRANSNLECDQNVKYKVKESIVEYLTPYLATCTTKDLATQTIENKKQEIINIANKTLNENGFYYSANVKINNEYFPVRSYNDLTLSSGFYDAVIIELGKAQGDNWWCVVYPPLCFTNFESGKNIIYKSKILEVINNFFN